MAKAKTPTFWQNKKGQTVIWQRPNRLAWVAAGSWFFARTFQDSGMLDFIGWLIFYPVTLHWAILEATKGESQFRRVLGLVVGILAAISLLKRLF